MPARLGSIDAISKDFAVPEAADTTFSDPDEIFNLSNPISLNAAQVVGRNSRTDASGNLVPGRADTAADIEAGTEAALNLGPEVMSSDPASSGDMGDVNLGLSPIISGMSDSLLAGTNFPPAGTNFSSPAGPAAQNYGYPELPSMDTAPKMALPGGSARTSIEDDGLANAMAAAQAGSNEINALGSDGYTGVFEPEFVEPTPAEIQASNRRAMAEAKADDASQIGRTFDPLAGVGKVTNLGSPIPGKGDLTNYFGGERYNPTSSLGLDPDPSDIQLEMAQPTGGGPVFTRPDGTVLTPEDSAAINAQARLEAGLANRVRGTATGVDTMALEEAAYPSAFSDDMQPVDDMQIVGATRAALKRAEGDVSALDRIAEARMPTDDMQIVPTAPAQSVPVPVPADPDGGGTAPKSNFDFD